MDAKTEAGFNTLKEIAQKVLRHSGYAVISLDELFSGFVKAKILTAKETYYEDYEVYNDDDDEEEI